MEFSGQGRKNSQRKNGLVWEKVLDSVEVESLEREVASITRES